MESPLLGVLGLVGIVVCSLTIFSFKADSFTTISFFPSETINSYKDC